MRQGDDSRQAGRRGEPVGRDFVRKAEQGRRIGLPILAAILAVAWYPFLEFGQSWIQRGDARVGYAVIVASGLLYLALWLRARRAAQRHVDDARAGRIRKVAVRVTPLKDERGEEVFPELAGKVVTGYERPHADDHLWWMLLAALIAGAVMHLQPWNSYVLKALLRDPAGAFTHGIPAPAGEQAAGPAHRGRP